MPKRLTDAEIEAEAREIREDIRLGRFERYKPGEFRAVLRRERRALEAILAKESKRRLLRKS